MPTTTKKGFGKGLASTILSETSIVSWYFSFLQLTMAAIALTPPMGSAQPLDKTAGTVLIIFAILLTLVTVAANVISIVFGAQAIRNFTYAKRNGLPKPVLAFVFGLIGLIGGCIILTYTSLVNSIIIIAFLSTL